MLPKISVCVPVYNAAHTIERCARSLFAQTYKPMEFIFVDDCSTDASLEVVRRIQAEYPERKSQVVFLRNDRNRGVSATRRLALKAVTGDFVGHCDSDDWVEEEFYEKLARCAVFKGADVALGSTVIHFEDNHTAERFVPSGMCISGVDAMGRLDELPGLSAMFTKIARRDLIERANIEWPSKVVAAEDLCYTMQVLSKCVTFVTVADSIYHYCINGNSLTRSARMEQLAESHLQVYRILSRKIPGPACDVARRHLVGQILFWGICSGCLSAKRYRQLRDLYAGLGGSYTFEDKSLWGQRMMKLADRSVGLSRLVSPFVKGRVHDYL